jgi:hypothetical protein
MALFISPQRGVFGECTEGLPLKAKEVILTYDFFNSPTFRAAYMNINTNREKKT